MNSFSVRVDQEYDGFDLYLLIFSKMMFAIPLIFNPLSIIYTLSNISNINWINNGEMFLQFISKSCDLTIIVWQINKGKSKLIS